MQLHPADRPKPQIDALIAALARHQVRWVLCGSHVLTLYGAELVANDLDVVPDLAPDNLTRVAACLAELSAVQAYWGGAGGKNDTLDACYAWRPKPADAINLDQLFVTTLGMLDIVIKSADPYESLMEGATPHSAGATPYYACDPRRVLTALEPRDRRKDRARAEIYARMRQKLGMPPL